MPAWDFDRLRTISDGAWVVYCVLLLHADWQTGECFPSVGTIAAITGKHKTSVLRALKELKAAGMVEIDNRTSDYGDRDNNLYRLPGVVAMARIRGSANATTVAAQSLPPGGSGNATEVVVPSLPKLFQENETNQNDTNQQSRAPRRARPALEFTPADMALADWFWASIHAMQPSRKPPNLKSWASTFRLMRDRDGRSDSQIRELVTRVQADSFWRVNILSPDKLREKWDDLTLKLEKSNGKHAANRCGPGQRFDEKADITAGW